MARDEDLLVFDYEGLASKSTAFFEALDDSKELAEQFVADPAKVLDERVLSLPQSLSTAEIEKANQFLFLLLSNPEFIGWAEEWQKDHQDTVRTIGEGGDARLEVRIDREELFRDLADAIYKYGDPGVLEDLAGLDLATEADLSPAEAPAELLVNESHIKFPRLPKPVNFNVAVNATVSVSLAGAVAAVVVLVVVIPVVVIGRVESETVDREDLQRLAGTLTQELSRRSTELRERGELGPGLGA